MVSLLDDQRHKQFVFLWGHEQVVLMIVLALDLDEYIY